MKLKRPKGYEASEYQLPVMIGNTEYPIANLKKGGVTHAFIILFGYKDEWHEVDARPYVGSSNIDAFKAHVESNSVTLVQLGVESITEPKSIEETRHDDYERLEKLFPAYDYHMVSKLHRYLSKYRTTPFEELRATLTRMNKDNQSVDDFIATSEFYSDHNQSVSFAVENEYITNDEGVIINPDTDYEYLANGSNVRLFTGQFKDGAWGNGLHVSTNAKQGTVYPVSKTMKSPTKEKAFQSVCTRALYVLKGYITMGETNLNEPFKEIQNLLNTMTKQSNQTESPEKNMDEAPDAPLTYKEMEEMSVTQVEDVVEEPQLPKRALSIEVIGNLPADKIQEFKDLNKETEKLIKANPLITVTDKVTLEKAKKNRAAMLKACTSIDGKEGLAATTRKAFNTVKATFDSFLGSVASKRREHYDALNAAVTAYENAEELRIAAQREAELKRVNERTSQLYAIPMTFNGEVYSIGSVYILPSQISDLSDEEFNKLVEQAKVVAVAEKAKADTDKSLLEQIEQLKRELALAKGEPIEIPNVAETSPTSEPVIPEPEIRQVEGLAQYVIPDAPVVEQAVQSTEAPKQTSQYPYGYEPGTELVPATNKPLKDFDTAYASVIAMQPTPAPFIKCREYFRMGLKAAMTEVDVIMKSTPVEGQPSKPEQIKQLLASILD